MNHEDAIPAAAAPTATTVPAAPERGGRRRLKVSIVLLLLAASGIAAYFLLRETKTSTEFRIEVEKVFGQLNEGKAEAVYENASFRFKQTLLVDKFVDMVDQMQQTLGKFVRVVDVIDVDRASTVAGMTARVELELEFVEATTHGEMSFHRDKKGKWKLLGMSVQIPKHLEHAADVAERADKRLKAPDEVIEQFNQILDAVREGKASAIHERASPSFREQRSVEQFQHLLDSHRSEMGDFVRVLAVISSAQNANRDRARVHALLQYEKAKTTGTFEFMRIGGEWKLYGFKVVVPEPLLPPEPAGAAPEPAPPAPPR
ncbi:MAG TPA: hypothetical protein VFU21_12600 [Kofleriaceae bacterium]|nr:hypothetical protein [Kofleriaceae bacterium]